MYLLFRMDNELLWVLCVLLVSRLSTDQQVNGEASVIGSTHLCFCNALKPYFITKIIQGVNFWPHLCLQIECFSNCLHRRLLYLNAKFLKNLIKIFINSTYNGHIKYYMIPQKNGIREYCTNRFSNSKSSFSLIPNSKYSEST